MPTTYPRAGQNFRGAGRDYADAQHALTRAAWGQWLSITLSKSGISVNELARQLATRPGDRNTHPRSLIRDWLAGSKTASESNCYRAGEALRALGLGWCSGPLALYAARHYLSFVFALRYIWSIDDYLAQEFACGLYIYSPILVDFDLNDGFQFAMTTSKHLEVAPTVGARERRKYDLLPSLPSVVCTIRSNSERANTKMASILTAAHSHMKLEKLPIPHPKSRLDEAYVLPSIQLLRSKAPIGTAWHVAKELLSFWINETLRRLPRDQTDAAASLELWNEHFVWGTIKSAESPIERQIIASSILTEHWEFLDVIDAARGFERYSGSAGFLSNRESEPSNE